MRRNVDEVLLLSFELNSFLHFPLLETLGPLLWRDVRDASENTLQLPILIFLGVRLEQDPRFALVPVAVLPRRFESELYVDRSGVVY